jgi:CheY-like chemotaxis protein
MALVLIIEDVIPNAKLVEASLSVVGFDVVIVPTTQEAFSTIEQQLPDLIVLDLRLPGSDMDGWEFIDFARGEPALSQVPIVVTSVKVREDDRDRAIAAGCTDYFSKPFKVNELRDRVISLAGQS